MEKIKSQFHSNKTILPLYSLTLPQTFTFTCAKKFLIEHLSPITVCGLFDGEFSFFTTTSPMCSSVSCLQSQFRHIRTFSFPYSHLLQLWGLNSVFHACWVNHLSLHTGPSSILFMGHNFYFKFGNRRQISNSLCPHSSTYFS
jgi:hypothetical protein